MLPWSKTFLCIKKRATVSQNKVLTDDFYPTMSHFSLVNDETFRSCDPALERFEHYLMIYIFIYLFFTHDGFYSSHSYTHANSLQSNEAHYKLKMKRLIETTTQGNALNPILSFVRSLWRSLKGCCHSNPLFLWERWRRACIKTNNPVHFGYFMANRVRCSYSHYVCGMYEQLIEALHSDEGVVWDTAPTLACSII